MFSTNYDVVATSIKEFQQSKPSHIEDSKYLNRLEEIINSFFELESSQSLPSINLRDKVALLSESLDKFGVRITPDEIKIWRTSSHPLVVETAKFLEIKNRINGTFPENGPGCNVVIMKDDILLATHSRGMANISKEEPMSINKRQHFGSVSKHFTAACMIHLANNTNKFSFSDDIRKHFPELPRFYFRDQEVTITINHLLTMRSGLPNMQALVFLSGLEDQDASREEKLHLLSSQEKIDLYARPGSEFNYCNTNYDILAKIAENILAGCDLPQKNLRDYADAHFFKPLGMTQTGFINPQADIYSQTMPGYAIGPEEKLSDATTRNKTWGPCGIIGTPEDMVKWNGKVPSEIFDKLIESPVALQADTFSYARGLYIGYFDNSRYKISVHSGGIEGFMTRYFKVIDMVDNEKSFGFFISTNIQNIAHLDFDNFTSSLVNTWIGKDVIPLTSSGSEEPKTHLEAHNLSREKAESIIGHYAVSDPSHKACIQLQSIGENSNGIRFMPDHEKPENGFNFALSSSEGMVFNSIDPPTARLYFNEQGFLFSDPSQGVIGLQFKRIL